MSQQLFSFHTAKVLVIGDSTLDTYWYGSTNRISPEAPVPVAHYSHSENRLAGASLVAANIKSLGGSVELISAIGHSDSDLNQELQSLLNKQGLNSANVELVSTNGHTNNIIRIVSQSQQLLKVAPQPNQRSNAPSAAFSQNLIAHFKQKMASCNVAILYDEAGGIFTSESLSTYIALCRQQGVLCVYVPANQKAFRNFLASDQHVDYVIISNDIVLDQAIISRCQGVVKFDTKKGLEYITSANNNIVVLKNTKEVDNSIGTCEVVASIFALNISINNDLNFILELSNAAMAVATREFGQIIINIIQLQLAYADQVLNNKYNYLKLAQEIQAAREKNQTIVFANGCFDVLHVGHIAYLDAASKRGDKLFVAINSDYSITTLKGETRPVNKLIDRIALLRSFSIIDWIVPFYTDTPCDFLSWLKPDVLVKGGDYNIDEVVGRDIVLGYGGKVEIIKHPYTEISSTKILAEQI